MVYPPSPLTYSSWATLSGPLTRPPSPTTVPAHPPKLWKFSFQVPSCIVRTNVPLHSESSAHASISKPSPTPSWTRPSLGQMKWCHHWFPPCCEPMASPIHGHLEKAASYQLGTSWPRRGRKDIKVADLPDHFFCRLSISTYVQHPCQDDFSTHSSGLPLNSSQLAMRMLSSDSAASGS